MMKRERIYRELLYRNLEKREYSFVQRELGVACAVSIGLVNFALKPLRRMGAVEIRSRGFRLIDPWKVLLYWASIRNIQREIVYSTYLSKPVKTIEASLPRHSIPTSYTAYRERYGDAPADYSEVYVYGQREKFLERFGTPAKASRANLVVLGLDRHLASIGFAPLAQVYVDLWNTDTWYARRFLEELGKKIRRMVSSRVP